MFIKIVLILFYLLKVIHCDGGGPTPIVLWHGMGDTCCFPFSLGSIKKLIEKEIPGVYVKSLKIGGNIILDYESGFFIHPNDQINYACKVIKKDEKLQNGFHAIGFSQGGQFLRALVQRCPDPQTKVLVSLGGQHQGVFGLPKCPSLSKKSCEYIRKLLNTAAYKESVQKEFVQATYWHDPFNEADYRSMSTFLSDINQEVVFNKQYSDNLNKLQKFIMVKFLNDTIVQPKESQWFEFYKPGQDRDILPLKESNVYANLGLNKMAAANKLNFWGVVGDHLQISEKWFVENLIPVLKATYADNNTLH